MKVDYRKIYGESELLDTFLNKAAGEVIREVRKSCKLSLNDVESKTAMFTKQTLSKYLGHSKISTTLDTYTHLYKNELLEVSKMIDTL